MGAIRVHHTDTSEGTWDGPANEGRLRNGESASYYRQAYAWVNEAGDPETKAAYKFIHHEVNGDGEIGAANYRATITGIGVLNGARGGTTIPDEDREGVWNHLAAHIRDAGMEPPALRSLDGLVERRSYQVNELRAVDESTGGTRLIGHAAVFDQPSEDMGFIETVKRGAFTRTLNEGADVRALFNHDPNIILGRTKSGTLRLAEDETGLYVEILLPGTQAGRDLAISVGRGDISQMSFAFRSIKDEWRTDENGKLRRELVDLDLYDVSPVTYPAYPQTSVDARTLRESLNEATSDPASAVDRSAKPGPVDRLGVMKKKLDLLNAE